ncbi:MAG: class I SAM-dependent methyltransferase [Pseudomonadota bacterium]|nr:class I SAM-dependent methyltransferase [Pseudomonadota bacterium]
MTDSIEFPELPRQAFDKADPSPDQLFYAQKRLVTHIDNGAVEAVTALYRELLPRGGRILDLMSSWVSHLPEEISFAGVTGHGMNAEELDANPRLTARFVRNLNAEPTLPLEDATFDAACLCVSVQYLQRPVTVFAEVRRVLKPQSPFIVTFSNRCFPTKAVAIWQALQPHEQQQLVALYMQRAGFEDIDVSEVLPATGDPLWAVIGMTPASAAEV